MAFSVRTPISRRPLRRQAYLPWLFNQFDKIKFSQVCQPEFDRAERDFLAGRYTFRIHSVLLDMDRYIARFDEVAQDPAYQNWWRRQAEVAGQSKDGNALEKYSSTDIVRVVSLVDANVWEFQVHFGDMMENGQVVATPEAMKMEVRVSVEETHHGAHMTAIPGRPGTVVAPGTTLIAATRAC